MFAPQKEKSEMALEDGNRNDRWQRVRAMQHIGMGIVYIIIAVALFYVKTLGTIELSAGVAYSLGTLLLVYGVFRIWRGNKELKDMKAGK